MLGRLLAATLLGAAAISVPAMAAQAAGNPPAKDSLTLVTGDIVTLTEATPGKVAATVTPAAGREKITFHTYEDDGGLRVVPSDAVPLIEAGRVDAELFDVQRLVADGYGDAQSPTLPLIVQGARTSGVSLASIGATAIKPAKSGLADFWNEQRAQARTRSASTIFLDGRVEAALDRSTAQIGAPAAWQQGLDGTGVSVAVLDTGVDATHPDLAGKIKQAVNFSSSPDTVDRFGHGTHVAATIAGTGAASADRSRKGVAYGADLLVGKVLGDDGTGYESEIIAGMQWAVAAGAKVVNLSLGGDPTDGLDPMSLAVNDLSESSGVLFVIAAGNSGPGDSTVGSPGSAADALTVGAVDREDRMATFSSRGPRVGDLGLKPEITAPGVDIVAARAAGTAMGTVVDDYYVAASGTSMATPHIAGAAAILAQQHPLWSGQEIKQALVSTAKTSSGPDVYAQGAGRVDLARATTQSVTGTPIADFGRHSEGESPAKVSQVLAYTNGGSSPVTLTLQKPAAVSLSATTVTVPAGGSASVTATIDFAALEPGRISGWIVASGTGVTVTTAVGAILDGELFTVTISALGRDGKPTSVPVLNLRGNDSRFDTFTYLGEESRTYEIQEGTYLLDATIESGTQATFVTIPELTIDKDLTLVVDARKGTPITIETPKPAEQRAVLSYYIHRTTGTGRSIAHGVMHFSTIEQVYVTPTKKVSSGEFEFSSRWQLVAPMVQTQVPGISGSVDANLFGTSPDYLGTRVYPLVKWGARDVRGKAVLIPADDNVDEYDQIAAAADAGAAVALLIRPEGRSAWTVWKPDGDRLPLVSLAVAHDDGEKLLKKAPSLLTLTLTTSSPYLYDVQQVSTDRIPDTIVHKVTTANSMRITSTYADNGGFDWVREQRFAWRPWQDYAWNDTSRIVKTPSVREEWVSAGDSLWQHRVHHLYPWSDFGQLQGGFIDAAQSYRAGTSKETWAGSVVRPADLGSTRTGNVLNLRIGEFVDGDGHYEAAAAGDNASVSLWRDGVLVGSYDSGIQDVVTSGGKSTYKLKLGTNRTGEDWEYGTLTDTEWTFTSGADGDLPLLGVDYDVQPLGVNLGFTARLKSLSVDVSMDDGRSWKRAVVLGSTVLVAPGRTPVSLRITAQDTAGNGLTQTVIRAF